MFLECSFPLTLSFSLTESHEKHACGCTKAYPLPSHEKHACGCTKAYPLPSHEKHACGCTKAYPLPSHEKHACGCTKAYPRPNSFYFIALIYLFFSSLMFISSFCRVVSQSRPAANSGSPAKSPRQGLLPVTTETTPHLGPDFKLKVVRE